jgi:hypothetical protein
VESWLDFDKSSAATSQPLDNSKPWCCLWDEKGPRFLLAFVVIKTLGLGLQLFDYTLSFRNRCENVFVDLNREEGMSWEITVRCFNPLETSRRKFRWNGC